jgi:bifunctional DNA-binding transcriptional regulator/antitoxin component of YhaV-PrlF toxin-antitoxin module
MSQDIHKDVTVTSRGQLTLPVRFRKILNLGVKGKVRIAVTEEGTVTVSPLPDVMSFFGKLKSDLPYDPAEKEKARDAMGKRGTRKE